MGISTNRDSKMGLPLSSVSSSARASRFSSIRSASRQINRPRSLADILRQAPLRSSNALRAADTARSTSCAEASTTSVNTSSVAGLMVGNFFAPSIHCPSISNRPGLISTLLAVVIFAKPRNYMGHKGSRNPFFDLAPLVVSIFNRRLLRGEGGRPLLHVRRQPFFRVFALEEQLLVLTLDGEGRFHGNLPARLHRTLDASHSLGRLVGRAELAGVLHDVFHEVVALEDVIDDAQFLGLFEGEGVARHHQFDGAALAHNPRQPLRPAGSRQY